MIANERDNSRLKGVLAKDDARPVLDTRRLVELIDLIETIPLTPTSEGEKTHRSVDPHAECGGEWRRKRPRQL